MRLLIKHIFLGLISIIGLLIFSTNCARESQPQGGLKDTLAPFVVKEKPMRNSRNINPQKITIYFNERIEIQEIAKNCIISPPLAAPPKYKVKKNKLYIELDEKNITPNSTYTFSFTNAIKDLNEGNMLNQYAYSFSNYDNIDTLEISGKISYATTDTISKSIFVLLYSDLNDSAIFTKKPRYITQATKKGTFRFQNIASGTYKIYALEDSNNDFIFNDPSEKIAFLSETISPKVNYINDTIRISKDSTKPDSISIIKKIQYSPHNIELTLFTNKNNDFYVRSKERVSKYSYAIAFSQPYNANTCEIIAESYNKSAIQIQQTTKADSVIVWLKDTSLIQNPQAKLIVSHAKKNIDTCFITKSFTTIPRLEYTIASNKAYVFSDDTLFLETSRPFSQIDTSKIFLFSSKDSIGLPLSTGEIIQKTNNLYTVTKQYPLAIKQYASKYYYENQEIIAHKLGINRFALYFSKPFDTSDIRISLKALPQLQNWYAQQYDKSTNSLLVWITSPEAMLFKNPVILVSYKNKQKNITKELSFSLIYSQKDKMRFAKTPKLEIALHTEQKGKLFIDNAVEIICNNPVTNITDSLFTMFDVKDSLKQSIITKIEISKTEPRKIHVYHTAQPNITYFISIERNAIQDIFNAQNKYFESTITTQLEDKITTFYTEKKPQIIVTPQKQQIGIVFPWQNNTNYMVSLKPMAITDIYGDYTDTSSFAITSPNIENFGSITVKSKQQNQIYFELRSNDSKNKQLYKITNANTKQAFEYNNLPSGDYSLYAILDSNSNKTWDTGSLENRIQAEKIILVSKTISIKAGRNTSIDY